MAPLGPPPYTAEQIHAMTSPEEKIRAQAELTSYIARVRRESEQRERLQSNAYTGSGYNTTFGNFNDYTPTYNPVYTPAYNTSYNTSNNHSYTPSYNQRGHYGRGRGFGGRGRGYTPYHPYARPPAAPMNAQNAVASNGTGIGTGDITESDEAKENEDPSQALAGSTTSPSSDQQQTEPPRLCASFTSTGVCSKPSCSFRHDADKQTVCKSFLYKGDCTDRSCELSHTASAHNTPTCLHFQSGRCTKEDCRFAHVHVNASALNCEAFGRTGYCEKGDACAELHAYECPTFANTGECSYTGRIHYPHVRRASRMRKMTRLSSPVHSPAHSPVRSPAHSPSSNTPATSEVPEDDMDTAHDAYEWMKPRTESSPKPQQFTEQADFVAFENDV